MEVEDVYERYGLDTEDIMMQIHFALVSAYTAIEQLAMDYNEIVDLVHH